MNTTIRNSDTAFTADLYIINWNNIENKTLDYHI